MTESVARTTLPQGGNDAMTDEAGSLAILATDGKIGSTAAGFRLVTTAKMPDNPPWVSSGWRFQLVHHPNTAARTQCIVVFRQQLFELPEDLWQRPVSLDTLWRIDDARIDHAGHFAGLAAD